MKIYENASRALARRLWPWLADLTCWLPKIITESTSVIRRNDTFDRLNDSYPWVCALSIMLTVILFKVHSIYFHDKGLNFFAKWWLLPNKTKNISDICIHRHSNCACSWMNNLNESSLTVAKWFIVEFLKMLSPDLVIITWRVLWMRVIFTISLIQTGRFVLINILLNVSRRLKICIAPET